MQYTNVEWLSPNTLSTTLVHDQEFSKHTPSVFYYTLYLVTSLVTQPLELIFLQIRLNHNYCI